MSHATDTAKASRLRGDVIEGLSAVPIRGRGRQAAASSERGTRGPCPHHILTQTDC